MSSNDAFCWESCLPFQGVNVLCEDPQKQPFVIQELQEVMGWSRLESPWEKLLHHKPTALQANGQMRFKTSVSMYPNTNP